MLISYINSYNCYIQNLKRGQAFTCK